MKSILIACAAAVSLAGCGDEKTINTDEPANQDVAVNDNEYGEAAPVSGVSGPSDDIAAGAISIALSNPDRTDKARARDAGRKPGQIMALAKIAPGQTVVDIASSPDYYAPMLSDVLGSEGKLVMVGPKRLLEFFPQAIEAATAYANDDDTDNVEAMVVNLDEMAFAEPVDRVLNILYYHDTVWSGVDRAAMNKAAFDALKPSGYYLIVDHAAKPGAGDEVTNDLHRIDPAMVPPEVEAAGFTLVRTSDILANPEDPKEEGVFGSLRSKTDRFIYLFQKPE